MAYRLKPSDTVEREIVRIGSRQLEKAIAEIRAAGTRRHDAAIHAARRHIKKVRALAGLVRDALGTHYQQTDRAMRAVARMLSPMTDGEAVIDTLSRLRSTYPGELPPQTFSAIRASLLRRKRRIAARVASHRVLQTAARQLRLERTHVRRWKLSAGGFRAIAPGLRRTYRAARKAMARAAAHPTADNYHAWRRRVKDHWFQLRLLERRCDGELLADQERLETLDGHLGEYHNCAILQRKVLTEMLDSRKETARFLRVLRRYQRELRRQAHVLGAQIYNEKPRTFIAAVRWHWRATAHGKPSAEVKVSWPRSA